jgi:hypothetical protein
MEGSPETATDWTALVATVVIVLAVAAAWVRLTRYRLGRHEFEVLIGNVVIRRVALGEIGDVFLGSRFPCEFWPSTSIFGGGCLTVRRKRGLIRNLTVTPHNPEQLRRNIYFALGWNPDPTPKTGEPARKGAA